MAVETQAHFHKRLGAVGRKHAAMAQGYTTQVRGDGLIVVKTKRRKASRFVPLKGLAALMLGFFIFKAFMLSSLGEITYNERVAKLQQGTQIEQGGAYVMQIDPVTHFLAGFLEPLT
ncbi:hypothetical protein [uncultured Tateyamaria sp.]|uniref:hypothetical protein n=1 Tax=uncultured Tateyamaria sp. TaxID=455651 RepID=UPI002608E723|nr:hypothetical protein [uncultured Tateyamaria sp.]